MPFFRKLISPLFLVAALLFSASDAVAQTATTARPFSVWAGIGGIGNSDFGANVGSPQFDAGASYDVGRSSEGPAGVFSVFASAITNLAYANVAPYFSDPYYDYGTSYGSVRAAIIGISERFALGPRGNSGRPYAVVGIGYAIEHEQNAFGYFSGTDEVRGSGGKVDLGLDLQGDWFVQVEARVLPDSAASGAGIDFGHRFAAGGGGPNVDLSTVVDRVRVGVVGYQFGQAQGTASPYPYASFDLVRATVRTWPFSVSLYTDGAGSALGDSDGGYASSFRGYGIEATSYFPGTSDCLFSPYAGVGVGSYRISASYYNLFGSPQEDTMVNRVGDKVFVGVQIVRHFFVEGVSVDTGWPPLRGCCLTAGIRL